MQLRAMQSNGLRACACERSGLGRRVPYAQFGGRSSIALSSLSYSHAGWRRVSAACSAVRSTSTNMHNTTARDGELEQSAENSETREIALGIPN